MLVYLKEFLLISMTEFDNQSSEAKTLVNKMGLNTLRIFELFII